MLHTELLVTGKKEDLVRENSPEGLESSFIHTIIDFLSKRDTKLQKKTIRSPNNQWLRQLGIKYHIGSTERTLFWKDRWAGDKAPAVQFPALYNCAVDKTLKSDPICQELGIRWFGAPNIKEEFKGS